MAIIPVPKSPGPARTIALPEVFTIYNRELVDFERVLAVFDWQITDTDVTIDLTGCRMGNFQALTLLVQYMWYLEALKCRVTTKYEHRPRSASDMMMKMGADGWRRVLTNERRDFVAKPGDSKYRKGLFALRDRHDVQDAIDGTRETIRSYVTTFPEYLSYIIAELLYNATEHGRLDVKIDDHSVSLPALMEFGYYSKWSRLSFIFSDLGIGIKEHLELTYPPHSTHQEAILHALQPNVSGTFRNSNPYVAKNNAGLGLTYSSRMMRRLRGDMYIVSYDGLVHVSQADITSRRLSYTWPGTFVYISLDLSQTPSISLEQLLAEVRDRALTEVTNAELSDQVTRLYVSMYNHFGKFLEDKDAAIRYRDSRIVPAVDAGKHIDLDFAAVETAPHSFLSALLATPARRLGGLCSKRMRIYNCPSHIREIIDQIIVDNT
jgi:hypothetical protein